MAKDPTRISESDMVLPAIEALSQHEDTGLTISTPPLTHGPALAKLWNGGRHTAR